MTDPVTQVDNTPPPPPGAPGPEARQWALFVHLSALLGFIFPFGNLVGPLILWQLKKDMDPFVDDQGKEALNFQITVALLMLVCLLLVLVVVGLLLMWVVGVGALVLTIIAAIKANEGQAYRYPLCWRLIK